MSKRLQIMFEHEIRHTNIKSYYQSMVTYLSRRWMLQDTNILYSWKRGLPIIFCWSRSNDLVLNSLNKKMRDMCMCTSTHSNFLQKHHQI